MPSSQRSSSSRLLALSGSGGGSKPINWRLLLLTCLLSIATVTGLLFFNPGGIVPRGLLPAPPKGKKKGKGKGTDGEEEGGSGEKERAGAGPKQVEVPVEKGEDEREYEALGARVRCGVVLVVGVCVDGGGVEGLIGERELSVDRRSVPVPSPHTPHPTHTPHTHTPPHPPARTTATASRKVSKEYLGCSPVRSSSRLCPIASRASTSCLFWVEGNRN